MNPVAQKALERLLTPFIAQQLNGDNPNEVSCLQTVKTKTQHSYYNVWSVSGSKDPQQQQ